MFLIMFKKFFSEQLTFLAILLFSFICIVKCVVPFIYDNLGYNLLLFTGNNSAPDSNEQIFSNNSLFRLFNNIIEKAGLKQVWGTVTGWLRGVKEEEEVCGFKRGCNYDSPTTTKWTPAKGFI